VPPPPQPAQAAAEGTDIGRCRMLCVPAAEGLKCDAVGDLLTVFVVGNERIEGVNGLNKKKKKKKKKKKY